MQGNDYRQVPLIMGQLAVTAPDAHLAKPARSRTRTTSGPETTGRLGHAEMRTSTEASSGFASTSGTGLSSKQSSSASQRLASACSRVSPWLETSTARQRARSEEH